MIGIIPARAGSSPRPSFECLAVGDHPRACGEQFTTSAGTIIGWGSSPRVRGAAGNKLVSFSFVGIIPARAGSRRSTDTQKNGERDHPRACGEQVATDDCTTDTEGSSPRVRGAVSGTPLTQTPTRIIPARAGSSCWNQLWGIVSRDHPRACGEQVATDDCTTDTEGIIPARAGSRRTCCHASAASMGSSPRVRGAVVASSTECAILGIIPARAGSSGLLGRPLQWHRDHPRACGEQQPVPEWQSGIHGIIPARAGSSRSKDSCNRP